ncbi:MAG: ABC transporter ATP-binding protein [Planctomycetaceae bacterium]
MSNYVEFYQVSKTFPTPSGPQVIVENFNLTIEEGEFVTLIGHSGCGKSTVLNMCSGLIPVTSGGIAVALREIDGPGPDRGMVFQSPCLLPWLTAHGNVLLAVDRVFPDATRSERYDIAAHYLELVGLGDALDRSVRQLSQGMQQRVGIARAFATAPKMLLLDEPFGMLDSLTRMELQEVLMELLSRDRKTTLMVTHDVDEALFLSDRIVMMTTGPKARVGGILAPTFPRPRIRQDVLDSSDYYPQREVLIEFLESQDKSHRAKPVATSPNALSPTDAADPQSQRASGDMTSPPNPSLRA